MKAAALCLALAGIAASQVPTGAITGMLRDPAGVSVSGARVTAVNLATRLVRTETTSEQGAFSFPALAPGEYQLTVLAERFARMERPALVEAGATTTADFVLRIGDVMESVTVEAASAQIRYDSHTVGRTIIGREIQNLPLNGRS